MKGYLPRVYGGVAEALAEALLVGLFTPRLRGCTQGHSKNDKSLSIYPAPAGVYPAAHRSSWVARYLPRVCGGVPTIGEDMQVRI